MPSAHAKLSPSSAERWISCPASIRMAAELPKDEQDEESSYAREGTLAHALAELTTGRLLGLIDDSAHADGYAEFIREFNAMNYPDGTLDEMAEHAEAYAQFIKERQAEHPMTQVLLEQQLDTGVPGSWGTSDAVLVSPSHVEIVDFKYGAGVQVAAPGNPQLRLYGCGALDNYGDLLGETETVTVTVYQPRLNHYDSEVLTPAELRAWRDGVVRPAAELTADPDAPFGPGEDACRWCPARGLCVARIEAGTRQDFGDIFDDTVEPAPPRPELMTPEMLATVLRRIGMVKGWVSDVEAAALEMAYTQGVPIPGYKVVRSGGQRKITDQAAAIQALIDGGFKAEDVADFKVKGFGELDKLVKKAVTAPGAEKPKLADFIGAYIIKTEGRESVVPEEDKREAISLDGDAAADFKEEA